MVDDHGDEATLVEPGIVLEEMLVDTDLERPRVLSGAASQLQLLVKHAVQKRRRAAIHAADRLQIAEVLAGPEQTFAIALGGAIALANAVDGLGERAATRAARKAPL